MQRIGATATLRLTSPQAANVSISAALIACIVALSSRLITPWNWKAWRVVMRRPRWRRRGDGIQLQPLARALITPPGVRVRIMKLKAGSSFCRRRSSRTSRSSCW
jgi:hypothetical protein